MVVHFRPYIVFLFTVAILAVCSHAVCLGQGNTTVTLRIHHRVQTAPLVLDSVEYENGYGEKYTVNRLKYYISNVQLATARQSGWQLNNQYYLVDAADTKTQHIVFKVRPGTYASLQFIIGVDSLKNVSGAQSGALDPLNGMFWTWNSGYIFFKLEGHSPSSTVVNNKMEYHIGGFSGAANALQYVSLSLNNDAPVTIHPGTNTTIEINANINELWQGSYPLKIATLPAMMTPGAVAKSIAENYRAMFTISSILNH